MLGADASIDVVGVIKFAARQQRNRVDATGRTGKHRVELLRVGRGINWLGEGALQTDGLGERVILNAGQPLELAHVGSGHRLLVALRTERRPSLNRHVRKQTNLVVMALPTLKHAVGVMPERRAGSGRIRAQILLPTGIKLTLQLAGALVATATLSLRRRMRGLRRKPVAAATVAEYFGNGQALPRPVDVFGMLKRLDRLLTLPLPLRCKHL